jgi:colicin import membrane protein
MTALEQQHRLIKQLADQVIAEERERLRRLKADYARTELEEQSLVDQAVSVVRQRQRDQEERERQEQERQRLAAEQQRQTEERDRQEQERLDQEALRKRTEEEQQRLQQEQQAAAAARKEQTIQRNYGSEEAMAEAKQLLDKLVQVKQAIGVQVKSNRAMFTEALRYRMVFTTKIGAVTNSRQHILQFFREINDVLVQGQRTSDLLYTWLLNNLAKQFVVRAYAC